MKEAAHTTAVVEASPVLPAASHWLEGGTAVLDVQGRIVAISDSLALWLGAPGTPVPRPSFWELLLAREPDWRAEVDDLRQRPDALTVLRLVSEDGGRTQYFRLELATNSSGAFVRLSSTLPPLAELSEACWDEHLRHEASRREMFCRLLRAEGILENLVQRWPGVIFTQRADFTLQFASPSVEDLTGVPLDEWRAQPQRFWQVVHEADVEEVEKHLKECVQQRRARTATFRIRHARTGRVAYLLEHRQPLVTGSGLVLGYEGVWLDVTRQIIAEKRLSSAAWKETLAVLTMGLAHDFSNIMAGILSLSESFLAQVDESHPFREGLALIKTNSLQAHQLVHRIINLHHGKAGTSSYCDLNVMLQELVDLVQKILPRRIQIHVEPAPVSLPLYVDGVEFRQVIINLTLNAAEAMPHGGRLVLRTSGHETLPVLANFKGTLPRLPAICLSVQDTGCGIKARHLDSIFDPFFTTKAMNKGSGLGLYNTRLFVERHGGAVSVASTEGAGTTFQLWLPQADFTEAERRPAPKSGRRRSLLVVGRADGGLECTTEFLRCHGYHVVVATSEAKAIDLLESGDYQFQGVLAVMEPQDATAAVVFDLVRQRNLPLKTILQLAGCHPDELDTQLVRKTDLLITLDMPPSEIVERLSASLPEPVYEPVPAL